MNTANMKLIAKRQLVGTGTGSAFFRDLYEDLTGRRHSVPVSHSFWMETMRKVGEPYPTHDEMFERVKLG